MNEPEGIPVFELEGELLDRLRGFMREKMRGELTDENLFWLCSGLITGIVSAVRETGLAVAIDRRLGEEGMPLEVRLGISSAFETLLNFENADDGSDH